MIKLINVSKSFGDKAVFTDYSLELDLGKAYCIMGESGCGKTTLLNLIMGLTKPNKGEISVPNAKISAVFQEDRLCEDFSAVSNVVAVTGKSMKNEIIELLKELGLEGSEYLPVSQLSGGMRRRVAIARALLAEFDILILDEPFKGLDDCTREKTADVILSRLQNKTLLVATHDIRDEELLNARVIKL